MPGHICQTSHVHTLVFSQGRSNRYDKCNTSPTTFCQVIIQMLVHCFKQIPFFCIFSILYEVCSYSLIGLSLLCSENCLLCFLELLQFCTYYARFYATPKINYATNNTQFNIYFYKAHLFMNLQLPLHIALIQICHMSVI